MAGSAGRYGCDGAGDGECVTVIAQEIKRLSVYGPTMPDAA